MTDPTLLAAIWEFIWMIVSTVVGVEHENRQQEKKRELNRE